MTSPVQNTCLPDNVTILLFYTDGIQVKETEQMEKQLSTLLPNTQLFKINIRTHPKMGASFQVQQPPLALALRDGQEIWRQNNPFSLARMPFFLLPENGRPQNEPTES